MQGLERCLGKSDCTHGHQERRNANERNGGWGACLGIFAGRSTHSISTYGLVRDDLDVLNMASSLEDLAKNVFRDPRVQSSHVQRALIWLWSGAAHESTSAVGGHHLARHGRSHCGRNRVGILRDHDRRQRWRRHVGRIGLAVACRTVVLTLAGGPNRAWRRGKGGRILSVLRHCVERVIKTEEKSKSRKLYVAAVESEACRSIRLWQSLANDLTTVDAQKLAVRPLAKRPRVPLEKQKNIQDSCRDIRCAVRVNTGSNIALSTAWGPNAKRPSRQAGAKDGARKTLDANRWRRETVARKTTEGTRAGKTRNPDAKRGEGGQRDMKRSKHEKSSMGEEEEEEEEKKREEEQCSWRLGGEKSSWTGRQTF